MSLGKVWITRKIPSPGLELLREAGVDFTIYQENEEEGVPGDVLMAEVANCDVLLPLLTEPIDRPLLEVNDRLLGVAQMAVGFNNIDVESATELGIPVTNTPGVLTETTADLTWALLMSTARRIPEAHNYMAGGNYKIWGPNLLLGADVGVGGSGQPKTLGILGYGRIGHAVARRASGFDMRILAHDPWAREVIDAEPLVTWADFDELLAESDFVTCHTPLTEDTHHLIGEAQLRAMKPTAILINTSRGPIVEEAALVRALHEGWIAGAGLDVFEDEPAVAEGLLEQQNAVFLPHIGSASRDTRGKMATMAATNAVALLRRESAPNCVNPEVYETEAYRRRIG